MMNTKTMRKSARDLVAGDVIVVEEGRRLIVLNTRPTIKNMEIVTAVIGTFSEVTGCTLHLNASQFTVELPAGLTPVQAAADKLLVAAQTLLHCAINHLSPSLSRDQCDDLCNLLNDLDPPKPPTLEEAISMVRALARGATNLSVNEYQGTLDAAKDFLARVPD